MGYNLHITKKHHYFDDEGEKITRKEWLEYVSKDPDLVVRKTDTQYVDVLNIVDCDYTPWLELDEKYGQIDNNRNATHAFVNKMVLIARELNAKVFGDDGEEYTFIPEGFRMVSDHEPPDIVEYHKVELDVDSIVYKTVVIQRHKPLTSPKTSWLNTKNLVTLLIAIVTGLTIYLS